jgi:hypothetical protein
MNFLKTREEANSIKAENSAAFSNARNFRFKLNQNSTGYMIFLDDIGERSFLLEHQFQTKKADGTINYYNYETCIRDIEGECPLCDSGSRPTLVAVSTVFDLTEYTKKDGTIAGPRKKLIVLKKGGQDRFLRKQEKLGGLKYKKFEVYRSSDQKAEATGTDAEFEKEIDPKVLEQFCPEDEKFEDWIKPFDYAEVFKPKTAQELRAAMGMSEPVGASEAQEPAKSSLKDLI